MRIRVAALCFLLALCVATNADATTPTYYLALGDSLAIGIQPSANGDVPTNQGYTDDLFAAYSPSIPGLQLTKLGCSGETTTTMIEGGMCIYPQGSQLAAAVSFLQSNPVSFVTLDIGANDIDHCIGPTGINKTCVATALATISTNLPTILTQLRAAAGANVPIFAMNYYDPFLAVWLLGTAGEALAKASEQTTLQFNALLQTTYASFSVPVADVADAYHITDFKVVPLIDLPDNVYVTLKWTWMSSITPDIHPRPVGYNVIAQAFAKIITL